MFVPIGSKIIIPAGAEWKGEDGKIARKWDKAKEITLKYQSMLFSQFYAEHRMAVLAEDLKREQ